jgi:hypothetical protein
MGSRGPLITHRIPVSSYGSTHTTPATAPPGGAGGGLVGSSGEMAAVESPLRAARGSAAAALPAPVVCTAPVGVVSVAEHTPLAWSADGQRLAAVSGNGAIFLLAFVEGTFRMTKVLTGGGGHAIRALAFHPTDSNVLVSAGVDGLLVWDVEAGAVVQLISHRSLKTVGLPATTPVAAGAHESEVECIAWLHGGSSAVTGRCDRWRWRTGGGEGPSAIRRLCGRVCGTVDRVRRAHALTVTPTASRKPVPCHSLLVRPGLTAARGCHPSAAQALWSSWTPTLPASSPTPHRRTPPAPPPPPPARAARTPT